MLLLKKIIHIILVGLLLFSLVLSGFCVMRIWKLEEANKTLTDKVDAVDNQNVSLKKRVFNLENDLDTLRADLEDHWHY